MAKGGKGRARTYSANDMRSMAKNPTSSHYKAATDNRANQLNPAHSAYASSRQDGQEGGIHAFGVTEGITFEELVAREIRVNREAIGKGLDGGIIGTVETSLRNRSGTVLRELIRTFVGSVANRKLSNGILPDELNDAGLRDLIWSIILQDFRESGGGGIDAYLRDVWVPKFLKEDSKEIRNGQNEEEEDWDDDP